MANQLTFRCASTRKPCPICGREKDCSLADEGPVKCMFARAKGGGLPFHTTPSSYTLKRKPTADGGFMYVPHGVTATVTPEQLAERARKSEEHKKKQISKAAAVWNDALGQNTDRVLTYLIARGIDGAVLRDCGVLGTSLMFAQNCFERYEENEKTGKYVRLTCPAMVAGVRDYSGNLTGVHRTFLHQRNDAKRGSANDKLMLGACVGRGIRLVPPGHAWADSGVLVIGEGIETTFSAVCGLVAVGIKPAAIAAMSDKHLQALVLGSKTVGRGARGEWAVDDATPIHTVIVAADFNVPKRGEKLLVGTMGAGEVSGRKFIQRIGLGAPWLMLRCERPTSTTVPEMVSAVDGGEIGAHEPGKAVDWNDAHRVIGARRVGLALLGLAADASDSDAAGVVNGWRQRAKHWKGEAGIGESEEGGENASDIVPNDAVPRDNLGRESGGAGVVMT